eukprot:TRINITY_DN3756_c0_g1_i2.p1 TRINITY_DN3756_c0_g1~~TRINITY_DN3756_c0_g1_i2.p1  ORF type:complete len:249 (+),score=24.79 TRINITY_DN3756_c0_g1_i2:127-873(+)
MSSVNPPDEFTPESVIGDVGDAYYFAYGSLIWNPGFRYAGAAFAALPGFERDMCMYSIDHRGTRERPGLVAGLRPTASGVTVGVVFRVAAADVPAAEATLEARENSPVPCYHCVPVPCDILERVATCHSTDDVAPRSDTYPHTLPNGFRTVGRRVDARIFVPLPGNWQFVPELPDVAKTAILSDASICGRSGTSAEYLAALVDALWQHARLRDPRLDALLEASRDHGCGDRATADAPEACLARGGAGS